MASWPRGRREAPRALARFATAGWSAACLVPLSAGQAQVNARWAARDRLEDGAVGENTGGLLTYAAPGMRWLIGSGLGLAGSIQVPVSQRLCGDQEEHATGRISLATRG